MQINNWWSSFPDVLDQQLQREAILMLPLQVKEFYCEQVSVGILSYRCCNIGKMKWKTQSLGSRCSSRKLLIWGSFFLPCLWWWYWWLLGGNSVNWSYGLRGRHTSLVYIITPVLWLPGKYGTHLHNGNASRAVVNKSRRKEIRRQFKFNKDGMWRRWW